MPVTVTLVPTGPLGAERDVIFGTTVKVMLLLSVPLSVTRTGPVVPPVGIVTTIEVFPQLVTGIARPFNVTVDDP